MRLDCYIQPRGRLPSLFLLRQATAKHAADEAAVATCRNSFLFPQGIRVESFSYLRRSPRTVFPAFAGPRDRQAKFLRLASPGSLPDAAAAAGRNQRTLIDRQSFPQCVSPPQF